MSFIIRSNVEYLIETTKAIVEATALSDPKGIHKAAESVLFDLHAIAAKFEG